MSTRGLALYIPLCKNEGMYRMRSLHVVVPMAGVGSRFTEAGFGIPKPLIPLDDGRPMFAHALDGLDTVGTELRHSFIVRGEHDREYELGKRILDLLPSANIIATNERPRGSLVDISRTRELIDPDEGMMIFYCDARNIARGFYDTVRQNLAKTTPNGSPDKSGAPGDTFDALLPLFQSDKPSYGYARLRDDGITISEIAEKRVISPHAIAAPTYFSSSSAFFEVTNRALSDETHPTGREYSVSDALGQLLTVGGTIVGVAVRHPDDFSHFGTPQELADYQARQNQPGAYEWSR